MENLNVLDKVVQLDGTLKPLGEMGGGSSDIEERIEVVETKIGNMYLRVDDDKPQYKIGVEGEWQDFSSGGGVATLLTTITTNTQGVTERYNVNSVGYNALLIRVVDGGGYNRSNYGILFKNITAEQCVACRYSNVVNYRTFNNVNDTGFTNSGTLSHTGQCLVREVYGINLTI